MISTHLLKTPSTFHQHNTKHHCQSTQKLNWTRKGSQVWSWIHPNQSLAGRLRPCLITPKVQGQSVDGVCSGRTWFLFVAVAFSCCCCNYCSLNYRITVACSYHMISLLLCINVAMAITPEQVYNYCYNYFYNYYCYCYNII